MRGTKIALLAVTAVAAISSFLFLSRGGFGGGHGDFDKVLFLLGLPWTSLRPSGFLETNDFVWLIALPFGLNVIVVFVVSAVNRVKHRARISSQ